MHEVRKSEMHRATEGVLKADALLVMGIFAAEAASDLPDDADRRKYFCCHLPRFLEAVRDQLAPATETLMDLDGGAKSYAVRNRGEA